MMKKKIRINGLGGQGVKYCASLFGKILDKQGRNVSLVLDYDTAARGGSITSDLIVSDGKVDSPIIDKADVLIDMTKNLVIVDGKEKSFSSIIEEKKSDFKALQTNMFYLGLLLKKMSVKLDLEYIKKILKEKFLEENLKSIEIGYK